MFFIALSIVVICSASKSKRTGSPATYENLVIKGNKWGVQFNSAQSFFMVYTQSFLGGDSGFKTVGDTESISAGVWRHIVGVFTGTKQRYYGDGELREEWSAPVLQVHTIAATTEPLLIGAPAAADNYHLDWFVDDVRIYDRALNSDEVEALFHEKNWP